MQPSLERSPPPRASPLPIPLPVTTQVGVRTGAPSPNTRAAASASMAAPPEPHPAPSPGAFLDSYLPDELAPLRTPTRLTLASPSTPAANFNPDDFLVSPPAHTIPRATGLGASRATPECKRRLFLDASPPQGGAANTNGNGLGATSGTNIDENAGSVQVTATVTPLRTSSLFTFGNLDTPRAATASGATASGRKRARMRDRQELFAVGSSSPINFSLPSPGRLLPPGSMLLPSPGADSLVGENTSAPPPPPATTNTITPIPVAVPGVISAPAAAFHHQEVAHETQHDIMTLENGSQMVVPRPVPVAQQRPTHPQPLNCQSFAGRPHSRLLSPKRLAAQRLFETPADCERKCNPQFTNGSAAAARTLAVTPVTPADESKHKCSCKMSKCLKLYCPCFAASGLCSASCTCKNCMNTANTSAAIDEARLTVLQRDPKAFAPRVRGATKANMHSKGCNCRKGCNKNYCVCRELGVVCGPRCTCTGPNGCQNGKSDDVPVGQPTKKRAILPTAATSMVAVNPSVVAAMATIAGPANPTPAVVAPPPPMPPALPVKYEKEMEPAENDFYRQLRSVPGPSSGDGSVPLFPTATPERVKADVLALASTPTTRSPRMRFAARREFPRPPRILRVKMGSGRALRKFAIGGTQ